MFTKVRYLVVWEAIKPFAGDTSKVRFEEVRRRAGTVN